MGESCQTRRKFSVATMSREVTPAFVKKFKTKFPEIVILDYEGGGGLSGEIEIVETEDGSHYFTKGWSDFVKDVSLNFGDFIVSRLINKKTFEIVIYDTSCCEKVVYGPAVARRIISQQHSDVNPAGDHHKNVIIEDRTWEGEAARCSSSSNHLIRTLKSYGKNFLRVPNAYVERFGLTKHNKVIEIKDPQGKVWPIKLAISRWGSNRQYLHCYLTTRWSNFVRVNDVTTGDTLDFRFVGGERNAGDVKMLEKGLGMTEI